MIIIQFDSKNTQKINKNLLICKWKQTIFYLKKTLELYTKREKFFYM